MTITAKYEGAIFGAEPLRQNFECHMPYLIHSGVLIDMSRGNPAAREFVDARFRSIDSQLTSGTG